jgi:hypothetical protein
MLLIPTGFQFPTAEAADDDEPVLPILIPEAGPNQNVTEGTLVEFDGTASQVINGTLDEYLWDFDAAVDLDMDGNYTNDREANGAVASHRFGDDGDYTATLTIGSKVEGTNMTQIAQNTVLVIDSSGSMQWNDPDGKRQDAATEYLSLMGDNDSASVVVFGKYDESCSSAGWLVHGTHLTKTDATGKIIVKNAIDSTRFDSGGTNIEKALQVGHQELLPGYLPSPTELVDCSPAFPYPGGNGEANSAWIEILLTDGEPTHSKTATDDEVRLAAYAGIRIFTIGLGTGIDEDYLRMISYLTGGRYYHAPNADDLESIYNNISNVVQNITDRTVYASDSLTVHVENVAPQLTLETSRPMDEGDVVGFWTNVTDPGSDDIHLLYEWGDGSANETYVSLNKPPNPDPMPSPQYNPRDISEERSHTFGDNWEYGVTVTAWDDDGAVTTSSLNAVVGNLPPSLTYSIPPSSVEGEMIDLVAQATDAGSDDLTFTWYFGDGSSENGTYYNDGSGPDPLPSPWGTYPFSAEDKRIHAWGDDGAYDVTVKAQDDDGGWASTTVTLPVSNGPPEIELPSGLSFDEGQPFMLNMKVHDPGSDDIEFRCALELGPTLSSIHFNDGVGPDPKLSPWGTYPFSVSEMIAHTYGDNGLYNVSIEAEDDDGAVSTANFQIEVRNMLPVIDMGGPYAGDENSAMQFQASATDSGSDDLTLIWSWSDGTTESVVFYNNGLSEDTAKSPSGTHPFSVTHLTSHTYGDNGAFPVTLRVKDDDGGIVTTGRDATVNNIDPIILDISWQVFFSSPRTQGYWNFQCTLKLPSRDHVGIQQEFIDYISNNSDVFGGISTREEVCDYLGYVIDSNMTYKALQQLMALWLNIASGNLRLDARLLVPSLNITMTLWEVTVWIEDIILNDQHRMETAKDTADDINNGKLLPFAVITLEASASDPGSDDLIFDWDWGDGEFTQHTYFNDGVGQDPYPSPEINPILITDLAEHSYTSPGEFVITLTVLDDDNGWTNVSILIRPTIGFRMEPLSPGDLGSFPGRLAARVGVPSGVFTSLQRGVGSGSLSLDGPGGPYFQITFVP